MHEFSLITDLMRKIGAIACEQGADRISRVRVKLGALAHISGEHFREHFEQAALAGVAVGTRAAHSGNATAYLRSVNPYAQLSDVR